MTYGEPWNFGANVVRDRNDKTVVGFDETANGGMPTALAERMVLCVNFLAGVPTERIQAMLAEGTTLFEFDEFDRANLPEKPAGGHACSKCGRPLDENNKVVGCNRCLACVTEDREWQNSVKEQP